MLKIWYTARQKFDPSDGQAWLDYIRWSKLTQLTEVVSLDTILCPSVINELTAEDWQRNVQENYHIFFFRDLDYLLSRVSTQTQSVNILAVPIIVPVPSLLPAFCTEA